MSSDFLCAVAGVMLVAGLLAGCGNQETQNSAAVLEEPPLGPYGPALGVQAHVVRSVSVKTHGEITGEFSGTMGEEQTFLTGLCDPTLFANFIIGMPGGNDWDEVWVTTYSKGAIGTEETGAFKLSYVEVTFRRTTTDNFVQRAFRGPGTITLTTHNAEADNRRMIGTMEGKSLEGRDEDASNTLDLEVSFDMHSSCGIKE